MPDKEPEFFSFSLLISHPGGPSYIFTLVPAAAPRMEAGPRLLADSGTAPLPRFRGTSNSSSNFTPWQQIPCNFSRWARRPSYHLHHHGAGALIHPDLLYSCSCPCLECPHLHLEISKVWGFPGPSPLSALSLSQRELLGNFPTFSQHLGLTSGLAKPCGENWNTCLPCFETHLRTGTASFI